ncbi:MAG: tetratricopeptide repeat protein [bacterium]
MKQIIRVFLVMTLLVGGGMQGFGAGPVTNVAPQAGEWLKKAYMAVVEAELARADHYNTDAAKSYREALGYYSRLTTAYPGWQTSMISLRVAECQTALTELELPKEPEAAHDKTGEMGGLATNSANRVQVLMGELREVQAALAQINTTETESKARQLQADRDRLQEEVVEAAKANQLMQRKVAKLEAKLGKSGTSTNAMCRAVAAAVKTEANGLMKTNDVAPAIALLTEAIELMPSETDLVVLLAVADCRAGRFDQAVKLMMPFDVWRAKNADALLTLGTAYMGLGEIGKARDAMEKVLAIKPDSAEAHYNLAQILITIAPPDITLSQEHYQRAIELGCSVDLDYENALRTAMIIQKMKKKLGADKNRTTTRASKSDVVTPGAKTGTP